MYLGVCICIHVHVQTHMHQQLIFKKAMDLKIQDVLYRVFEERKGRSFVIISLKIK